jgi:hypothetical protein
LAEVMAEEREDQEPVAEVESREFLIVQFFMIYNDRNGDGVVDAVESKGGVIPVYGVL